MKQTKTELRTYLENNGWKMYRLARETGIGDSTLASIVNGVHEPSWSKGRKIADALGLSMNQFDELLK